MKFAILLSVVVSITSATASDFCNDHQRLGNACKTCKDRVLCVPLFDNEWREFPLNECESGFRCDGTTGNCIESDTPCFGTDESIEFQCLMEGLYPDPYDCSQFHLCTMDDEGVTVTKLDCPTEQKYSAKTQRCQTLPEKGKSCAQSACKEPGQVSAWPDDDNIYYICLLNEENKLYPAMLRCLPDERFHDGKCVKKCQNGDSDSSSTKKKEETSQPEVDEPHSEPPPILNTPATNTTSTSIPKDSYRCLRKGLQPHPNDCGKYYHCDSNMLATMYECPPNTKFDTSFGVCIRGTCPR